MIIPSINGSPVGQNLRDQSFQVSGPSLQKKIIIGFAKSLNFLAIWEVRPNLNSSLLKIYKMLIES